MVKPSRYVSQLRKAHSEYRLVKMGESMDNEVTKLMSRERSTMVSSWTEVLGIEDAGDGKWSLGVYVYNWLGSIDDLIPEEERYEEDGSFKVPDEYNGHRIRGLADDEYLEADELVKNPDVDTITFDKSSLAVAREYASRNQWDRQPGFESSWKRLLKIVGSPVGDPHKASPRWTRKGPQEGIPKRGR